MAPLSDEQLSQIRDERKEQIMEAALHVFSRRGISGTKMSMIAAEAGISHGLLYHYFKSKDELFTELVQMAMVGAQSAMIQIYELPGSPLEKIRVLTKEILDESGTPFFLLIHQARTAEGVPEKAVQLIEQYSMETFVAALLPLFQEGQQAGEIVPGNLEELIASYLSILSGLMVLNAREDENYRLPDIDLLLRMITVR
ncbi:MAG TPA: helix-turn-helix domain-containing protein [Candidatus Bathyarchaeia archaeon]|nr:helix-turn-helix domain-containing protein [Candidatus Bathyarchaeia archaeon]